VSGAAAALQAAAMAALEAVEALGAIYPGPPLQAALPYAVVECGPETDWGHKSGRGRELRLAVTVRAGGERPDRVQVLAAPVDAALEGGLGPEGWALVTLTFLRARTVADTRGGEPGWAAVIEYRARMLAA
jgi:hypothetical protein